MHITPQEGSSSSKKKDLAFKASQKKKSKEKIAYDSSSDDEVDDASLALMVRRTAKMLKKLNKNGIKFNGKKKKFFTSTRRKPISEMDCYNCGELGHCRRTDQFIRVQVQWHPARGRTIILEPI